MGFTKAHLYPRDLKDVSYFGKVIGHPERLKIIYLLNEVGGLTTGQMAVKSVLSVPSISQHLAMLRKYEIVYYNEFGPIILYYLNKGRFRDGINALLEYREKLFGEEV